MSTSFKAKVAKGKSYDITFEDSKSNKGTIDGKVFEWDVIGTGEDSFHVLKDNISYNVEVVESDLKKKEFIIKVNGNRYQIKVKDRHDQLLKTMGLADLANAKVNELKAPMPGLVLDVMVKNGQEVKAGEPLLVLEAMKMENVLKSPAEGKVKKVQVEKAMAVEKNAVLIKFE